MSRAFIAVLLTAIAASGCASMPDAPSALPDFVTSTRVGDSFATTTHVGDNASLRPGVVEGSTGWRIEPEVAGWSARVRTHDDHAIVVDQSEEDRTGAYRLDTGDKIRVFVYAQPSLSRIYTVDQEGFISVPLIGETRARGQTTRGLAAAIRSRLSQSYVRDPHVAVDISQNRPFFILGEVKAAGQYPFVPGMTVEAAVAIAGGFAERADERKVQITRRKNGVSEKLDAGRDALVRPGDTIHVNERWF